MDDWTPIYETEQLYRAEIVKSILNNNDLEAVILNQRDSSYGTWGTVKVMVKKQMQGKQQKS